MRIGLVGCVKGKLNAPAPAQDLYTSTLFRGRRTFVERSSDRWFILSAKYGLVEPTRILEPYDETLTRTEVGRRRAWSTDALRSLDRLLGDVHGYVFEIHAGAAYRSFGLADGLVARGARVENPTEGLSFGRQLAFYAEASG